MFTRDNGTHNGIGIVYGLRSFNNRDTFGFDGSGGILGHASVSTLAENDIVASQVGIAWAKILGRWWWRVQATVLAGYNDGRVDQAAIIGEELQPGAINRLLIAQPTYSQHFESHHVFSPGSELRAEAYYHFTNAISLNLAWSGLFFDNVLLAENRTQYSLPDMGLRDPGDQHLLIQEVYCGIEYLH